jgi:hypothetical protein
MAILDLDLLALSGLQDTAATLGLLSLAEAPAASSHVQTVSVDQTVALEGRRIPLGAGDGVDVQHVHGVDLLERAVLGLDHEEVDGEEEQRAAHTEHETVEVVNPVGNQSRAERNDEVEEPVGSCREGHAGRTVASWVKFTNNGPDERSPSGGEGGDEQAGEDNHDVSGLGGAQGVDVVQHVVSNESVDEETHEHPGGSTHHSLAAADVLNDPETEDSGDDVDGTQNDGSDV